MRIRADFTRHEVVTPQDHQWVASPQPGVERMMLDRIGEERARATSLVRYLPESIFPVHGHPGGEEILVLEGTFSDSSGDFGAGWYLRNPPGSSHQPSSREGALIFVKLWQMVPTDAAAVRIDTRDPTHWRQEGPIQICPLFQSHDEEVRLLRLPAAAPLIVEANGGAELLVIKGLLQDGQDALTPHSWLRLPPGSTGHFLAGSEQGATVYMKTGHLNRMPA
ncbi:MAG TPA: cupin domain-containing protein [Aquabacterium sp.]|nr:cupin domain-containing protein [Aquabacterium sp.]